MNLYATVTSERAGTGQGGKHLAIVVTDKERQEIARLLITIEDGGPVISYDYEDGVIMARWRGLELPNEKGNKQKGELCKVCGGKLIPTNDKDWPGNDCQTCNTYQE